MKVIELQPIRERSSDYEDIEKEIQKVFREEIYLPLLREFNASATLKNAFDYVAEAIRDGSINFERGGFTGSFSAAVSRELRKLGAKWDRKTRSYRIPSNSLPIELKSLIGASESRFQSIISRIDKKLSQILPEEIAGKLKLEKLFDSALWRVDGEVQKSMKRATVAPQLTPGRAKVIADDYTNNMKLYIQEWTEKEIKELRKKVQTHSFKGLRQEGMVKMIKQSYGVSQRKAKFLARQETSLLMTTFKQKRYEDAGIKQYRWRCVVGSPNHPVRPAHKRLDGKIFSFDNPPVTSPNGARNNPGQDFNCRCQSIPIVKFT